MSKVFKKIKRDNFYQISGWMIMDLGLKGNELIIYAIIYGFTQDGSSLFSGTAAYLSELGNMSRRTVMNCLNDLVDKGLLKKIDKEVNKINLVDYQAIKPEPAADAQGMQNLHTPYAKSAYPLDNNIDKDIDNTHTQKKNKKENPNFIRAKEKLTDEYYLEQTAMQFSCEVEVVKKELEDFIKLAELEGRFESTQFNYPDFMHHYHNTLRIVLEKKKKGAPKKKKTEPAPAAPDVEAGAQKGDLKTFVKGVDF